MSKSSTRKASRTQKPAKRTKPEKPYDGFPLTANGNGQWSKKYKHPSNDKSKVYYFGDWDDWQTALENYQAEWPYILQHGKRPDAVAMPIDNPGDEDSATVGVLCDAFLQSKQNKLDAGELSMRTFQGYEESVAGIVDYFGRGRKLASLSPADFDKFRARLSVGPRGRRSPVTLARHIRLARIVFKFASVNEIIPAPVRFGSHFDLPTSRTLRIHRQSQDKKMFEADEIRRMLANAKPVMRAMILLGVNAGLGNTDVAGLPQSAIDFSAGWLDYSRQKTGVERRVPLWPETIAAVRECIEARTEPENSDDAELCFLTRLGRRWVRNSTSGKQRWVDSVGGEFKKLLKSLDINGHRGFYALRHSFETIAGESCDQVSVNHIMGHVDSSMSAHYRERISDERLQAVVDTVHAWLFPADDQPDD